MRRTPTSRSPHDRMHRLRKRPLQRYRYVRLRWRVLFALIDWLGTAVFAAGGAIRRLLFGARRTAAERSADPKVILLVQLDHLGDAIISTAMLPALRSRYPKASIEVLAGPWNREVFEGAPEVDRVLVSKINRFARAGPARLLWIPATLCCGLALRRRRIDLGVDVRGEFPVALMLWMSGARRRLGWACGGGGFLLTDSAPFVPGRPEVDSRWALLAELGIERPAERSNRRPRFRPGSEARQRIAAALPHRPASGHPAGPRLVFHTAAGTQAKSWPVEHWRELLGRVLVAHGAEVVLAGTAEDRIIARQILGGRPWPGVVDWTGRLTVDELAALLQQADVVVGADSGPAHLAAAVGVPVVVLFSGTNDPHQWQPSNDQVTVLRHGVACSPCHRQACYWPDHPCMVGLEPIRVAAEIERWLAGKGSLCCGRPATSDGELPHAVDACRKGFR